MGDFLKPCPSRAKAGFKKITKWVKNGFLMIIHIYAKVSLNTGVSLGKNFN
ncbi:hypothetical protein BTHERMOSOX_1365 [Bathymodiolus thermophilus thioautotrophic gill symbiont]|nr:hypothetical protein BTHERMOSOX_1365 [Bathymodiolus thermophilus thioautotrophic gill symbiont]